MNLQPVSQEGPFPAGRNRCFMPFLIEQFGIVLVVRLFLGMFFLFSMCFLCHQEADRQRREEFKKYEMEKKFEKEARLKHINDTQVPKETGARDI